MLTLHENSGIWFLELGKALYLALHVGWNAASDFPKWIFLLLSPSMPPKCMLKQIWGRFQIGSVKEVINVLKRGSVARERKTQSLANTVHRPQSLTVLNF